mmetsp:Transcript_10910/g.21794  ORF Transcript_10910/g.21794 Transcript_10910/m.21794 type:complete len:157 (+) Transcript_10910:2986-3456(+)
MVPAKIQKTGGAIWMPSASLNSSLAEEEESRRQANVKCTDKTKALTCGITEVVRSHFLPKEVRWFGHFALLNGVEDINRIGYPQINLRATQYGCFRYYGLHFSISQCTYCRIHGFSIHDQLGLDGVSREISWVYASFFPRQTTEGLGSDAVVLFAR